jgi:hypothetical protein
MSQGVLSSFGGQSLLEAFGEDAGWGISMHQHNPRGGCVFVISQSHPATAKGMMQKSTPIVTCFRYAVMQLNIIGIMNIAATLQLGAWQVYAYNQVFHSL